MSLKKSAICLTTLCGILFSIQYFYDNDARIKGVRSRAIEKYVAKAVKNEFKHQK